jgi:CubicO group peptidase (beta-lactamase class C family)
MLLFALACTAPDDDDVKTPADPADTAGTDTGTPTEPPGDGTVGADDPRFDDARQAARGGLRRNNATGVSVAVSVDGVVVWAEGIGEKDPDDETALVTPRTLFNIGSDTKKLTAVALLREVEAGRLSLDDTLADALPGLVFANESEWSAEITMRHLLTHQSGFYDDTNWLVDAADDQLAAYAYGDFAANEYVMATPGRMWNYSNPNFSIAGLVVEELTGRAFGDVVEDDVLRPLGMERSYARVADVIADGDYADGVGYDLSEEVPRIGTQPIEAFLDGAWVRPAGGVWSTATEMLKTADFLVDGDTAVLSDELRADMVAKHVLFYPEVDAYAYGDGVMVYDGYTMADGYHPTPVWMHGGNHLAYTSLFAVIPEAGFAISVLSNGYGDDFNDVLVAAIEALVDTPVGDAPAYDVDPETFPEMVGTYTDPWMAGDIVVGLDGETLTVAMPAMEELGYNVGDTLTAVLPGVFTVSIDGVAYDLTFVADDDGTRRWVRNRVFVATRAPDLLTATRPRATREEIDAALMLARATPGPVVPR